MRYHAGFAAVLSICAVIQLHNSSLPAATADQAGTYFGTVKVTTYSNQSPGKFTTSYPIEFVVNESNEGALTVTNDVLEGTHIIYGNDGGFFAREADANINVRYKFKGKGSISGTLNYMGPTVLQDAKFSVKKVP